MTDKWLDDLFARNRLFNLPTLSSTQKNENCSDNEKSGNNWGNWFNGSNGSNGSDRSDFQYYPSNITRNGQLVDQLEVYREYSRPTSKWSTGSTGSTGSTVSTGSTKVDPKEEYLKKFRAELEKYVTEHKDTLLDKVKKNENLNISIDSQEYFANEIVTDIIQTIIDTISKQNDKYYSHLKTIHNKNKTSPTKENQKILDEINDKYLEIAKDIFLQNNLRKLFDMYIKYIERKTTEQQIELEKLKKEKSEATHEELEQLRKQNAELDAELDANKKKMGEKTTGGDGDQVAAELLFALEEEKKRLNNLNAMFGGMRY